ncbi:phospholipase D-like domain-containing protein [Bradyrhizobium yuanmingense]|uniref:phospholipase D-like domain-containing protein n=1 Tax=Bradyrhizobium yuanmingense TaxID=108015 RepID=UPI0021A44C9B|nr:phospholipase D-like domain-containing protein [Bradyrhizobium sp. CB1024]UWU82995.1 phospholipase D-like domain-containing protein [Bradyrhizobium sp. CB1024]
MGKVIVRSYLSPTLVLLAMDWPDGGDRKDFLGFAIRRTPPFRSGDAPVTIDGKQWNWLPNRVGFDGPAPDEHDLPTNQAPIQKFMWWDARIDEDQTGSTFTYVIAPVVGKPDQFELVEADAATIDVQLPLHEVDGIGTYFNRAVVSSQAFAKKVEQLGKASGGTLSEADIVVLRTWLSNGLGEAVGAFLSEAKAIEGAVYHFSDEIWVAPAVDGRQQTTTLVIDWKWVKDETTGERVYPNQPIKDWLTPNNKVTLHDRTSGKIMHNKILIAHGANGPTALLCGSANFTTGGLTSQANVVHTFASEPLAAHYQARVDRLKDNPTMGKLGAGADWTPMETVGSAGIRAFFSPEKDPARISIDTIVRAIHSSRSSVLFCLFTPTDDLLRDACFAAGDNGKMMFGLVNNISEPKDDGDESRADVRANVELYHRSRDQRDVFDKSWYGEPPEGFWIERELFPGEKYPGYPPVLIHHKFIVVDGETSAPVVFSGSANMSNSSLYNNDENILEIRGSQSIARTYMAEFLRLYEHYRARAIWERMQAEGRITTYKLQPDARWAKDDYKPGTAKYRSRRAMTREP